MLHPDLSLWPPQVSLNWSSGSTQPGQQVALTVTGLESRSRLGIVVTGTHDDAPQSGRDFKVEGVRQQDTRQFSQPVKLLMSVNMKFNL